MLTVVGKAFDNDVGQCLTKKKKEEENKQNKEAE